MKNWEKYSKQIAKNLAEGAFADDFIIESGCINNDRCETCPCGNRIENTECYGCYYSQEWLNEGAEEDD